MEFGKVAPEELDTFDLSLPPDAGATANVLKKNKSGKKPNVYIGCAKWGRKDWIGKLYPPKTKEKDFFELYAKQFNAIEFNAIYYRIPTPEQVQLWKSKVDKKFLFCPKFTNIITHMRRLKNAQADTDKFLECVHGFGKNLGPIFLMPHPQMGLKRLDTILEFLEALPKDIKVFLELRNAEWYKENNLEKILKPCERLGIGTVLTDTSGRRDMLHNRLTTPDAFIRFVGNGLHPTDYTRIDEWVARMKVWIKEGIHNIYFFMHQHEELYSPELVKYLVDKLNAECGLKLHSPELLSA